MDQIGYAHHRATKALRGAEDARELMQAAQENALIAVGELILGLVPDVREVHIDERPSFDLARIDDPPVYQIGLVLTDDGGYVDDEERTTLLDSLSPVVTLAVQPFLAAASARDRDRNMRLTFTEDEGKRVPVIAFAPLHS